MYYHAKKYAGKKLTPLKSIKAYCKEQCCAGDTESWKNCTFTACLLFRYRLGLGSKAMKKKHVVEHSFQENKAISEQGSKEVEA